MEKEDLEKLILQWKAGKSKRPSKMDRPLTYKLYNELLKPKMRRSEKDCNCLDRDSDYKVTRHIERYYSDLVDEPMPITSNVKIDASSMMAKKPKATKKKTTRKRTTKKKNEGTTPNT